MFRRMLIGLSFICLAVLGCSQAWATQMTSAMRSLIAAANKEGELDLSWSQSSLGGSGGATLFQTEFNKAFGTHIHFNFSPGPEMARIGNQLAIEWQTHEPAHADVYLGAAAQIAPLVKLKMFAGPDWSKYLPDRIRSDVVEENNQFVRIATGLSGATYNAQLAPFTPKTLMDFLDPRWKGKIASTPYAAGFDVLAANDVWGVAKTDAYVKKLSKQISGLIRCGDGERLATGEFIALVMDCTGQEALAWAKRGAPLKQVMPLDAAQKRYYYMGVPKGAKHPNAARLFISFLLTEAGQKLIYETWGLDLDSFPRSEISKQIKRYQAEGVKFKEVTIPWWLAHPEIEKNKIGLIKMLTQKS